MPSQSKPPIQRSAPKTPVKSTISIPSTFNAAVKSIKDNSNTDQIELGEKEVLIDQKDPLISNESFSEEELREVLGEIIGEFKSNHKNLETTLLKQPFELIGEKVVFLVNGEIHQDVFLKIRSEVTGLLKVKLNNQNVILDLKINKDENPKNKFYTSSDKLLHLKEKSKAFEEFQRRFGLQTDF